MGKSFYYKKRIKSGFTRSEIANLLGIDCKQYELIERGKVKMPKNLIDKFNEIINKGKEKDIDRLNREKIVNDFWNEYCIKDENNHLKIKDKMKEFNIINYKELGTLLGYKDSSIFSHYFNRANASFEFKNKLYSFFENELNIQDPTNIVTQKISDRKNWVRCETPVVKWYRDFDFIVWLEKTNESIQDIANKTGLSRETIARMIRCKKESNNDYAPQEHNLKKFKKYIDNYKYKEEPKEEIIENVELKLIDDMELTNKTEEPLYTVDVNESWFPVDNNFNVSLASLQMKLTLKYQKEIESLSESITSFEEEIRELEKQIEIKNNIIATYKREIATYERVIKDINEEE